MSATAALSLFIFWVLMPTGIGAAAGALLYSRNRLKAGLIGAAAGCVAGQSLMLWFAAT